MIAEPREINEYLLECGIHPDLLDLEELEKTVINDIEVSMRGRSGSLEMIPTYLVTNGEIPKDEPVAVIEAGGTILRTALVTFTEDGPRIEMLKAQPMPGSLEVISLDEYHRQMGEALSPLLEFTDTIGYCFSYNAEVFPDHDGRLTRFSKGVCVEGSDGMMLCRSFEDHLRRSKDLRKRRWVLINDSAAAVCGGLPLEKKLGCSGAVGFILGTGINICCPENPAELTRYPDASSFAGKTMFVNTEVGSFDKVPASLPDEILMKTDIRPGLDAFEKMTSGAYLGKLVRLTALGASKKGILSSAAQKLLEDDPSLFTTPACAALCGKAGASPLPGPAAPGLAGRLSSGDRAAIAQMTEMIFRRSGRLCAVALSAALAQTGLGRTPEAPALILAEGSTFLKSPFIREETEKYLTLRAEKTGRGFFRFASEDNVNITGTAAAALLNR